MTVNAERSHCSSINCSTSFELVKCLEISGDGIGDFESDMRGVDFSMIEDESIEEFTFAFLDGMYIELLRELEEEESLRLVLVERLALSVLALVT